MSYVVDEQRIDPESAPLSEHDLKLLGRVRSALDFGLEAKEWWHSETGPACEPALEHDPVGELLRMKVFDKAFRLMRRSGDSDGRDFSYGFYHRAPIGDSKTKPLVGLVQQMFFDQPKAAPESKALEKWRDNLREFVLRYLMRVSVWGRPREAFDQGQRTKAPWLRPVSMCPERVDDRTGFSYSQIYFKRSDGTVGKTREPDQRSVIDLRQLGSDADYHWIVMRLGMEDFKMPFRPPSLIEVPYVILPMAQTNHVVVNPDLVILDEDPAEEGIVARYGFGNTLLRDPTVGGPLSYGPAKFDGGYSQTDFSLLEDGSIIARVIFLVERPEQTFNLPLNPLDWGLSAAEGLTPKAFKGLMRPLRELAGNMPFARGFDPFLTFSRIANTVTAGQAEKQLCISREQVEKMMMIESFSVQHDMLLGAQHRWRRVRDWTVEETELPAWARP